MNKTMVEQVKETANKVKMCAMGKIAEDINSRLPEKPVELSKWEKYEFIKSGKAKLKELTMNEVMNENYSTYITRCFTYPIDPKQKEYDDAVETIKSEKHDRELAAELAFNRVANERILEMIDAKTFLDTLDRMAQEKW